jgi:hypothetical protein
MSIVECPRSERSADEVGVVPPEREELSNGARVAHRGNLRRHLLAWRFVQWAVEEDVAGLGGVALRELLAAGRCTTNDAPSPRGESRPELAAQSSSTQTTRKRLAGSPSRRLEVDGWCRA